jgi:hypothetical protein
MSSFRLRFLTLVAMAAATASPAHAQVRTFNSPQLNGFDVSYCGTDSDSCGESMAMAWCRSVGYDYASDWAARTGIDASSRAIRLDDGAVCEGAACESFAAITCGREGRAIPLPILGAAATNATVLSPNRRSTQTALEAAEYSVVIPGCSPREDGVFVCDSMIEYQHCRTLMINRMTSSCRAGFAFEDGFAEPRAARPDEYRLTVDSNAKVKVTQGDRGFGQIKGKAEVVLSIRPPIASDGAWCLQRDRYVYYPTGPKGGLSELGESADCDEPIEFSFEANNDDLIRAYDLCETFAAWGMELTDTIDVVAAGLFQIRSANPTFVQTHGGGSAVIAPYVAVEAPLTVDCRN